MNPRSSKPTPILPEIAVATHVCILLVGVSWAFGGNADWVRTPISAWGSLGIVLALATLVPGRMRDRALPGTFRWSWPVIALNCLVGLSCLTPGFRFIAFKGDTLMVPLTVSYWSMLLRPVTDRSEVWATWDTAKW